MGVIISKCANGDQIANMLVRQVTCYHAFYREEHEDSETPSERFKQEFYSSARCLSFLQTDLRRTQTDVFLMYLSNILENVDHMH